MAKILTTVNTLHEHYLTLKYDANDFPRVFQRIDVTSATTVSTTAGPAAVMTSLASANFATGTKELFLTVDTVTDIATDIDVTILDGVTPIATGTVLAHAGIDSIFKMLATAPLTATPVITATITGGSAGVTLSLMVIDGAGFLDLGANFMEGLTFSDGALTVPVARGWDATAFSKRTRSQNSWTIKQLYCSATEGIANLRGKTILIKDEIHVDGGAEIKEVRYVVVAQVSQVPVQSAEQGDTVDAGGYYRRNYVWVRSLTSLSAMV